MAIGKSRLLRLAMIGMEHDYTSLGSFTIYYVFLKGFFSPAIFLLIVGNHPNEMVAVPEIPATVTIPPDVYVVKPELFTSVLDSPRATGS